MKTTPTILLVLSTLLLQTHTIPLTLRPATPGSNWADSYSSDGKCYCISTYDHGIRDRLYDTPKGPMTIIDICNAIGRGPGKSGNPVYNDIQCGNGPANDARDESDCPGRVDLGGEGCDEKGPKWDLSFMEEEKKEVVVVGEKSSSEGGLRIPGKIESERFNGEDGIRVQECEEGGENIAYVSEGEMVEYEVVVEKESGYKAEFRVASEQGGGVVMVMADGKKVGEFEVKKTGAWQKWYTESIEVELKGGKQMLKLMFSAKDGASGYLLNINYMEFTML